METPAQQTPAQQLLAPLLTPRTLVQQVESLNFDDLEKLVTALKKRRPKTDIEELEEQIDDLESRFIKHKKTTIDNFLIVAILLCMIMYILVR